MRLAGLAAASSLPQLRAVPLRASMMSSPSVTAHVASGGESASMHCPQLSAHRACTATAPGPVVHSPAAACEAQNSPPSVSLSAQPSARASGCSHATVVSKKAGVLPSADSAET